VICGDLQGGEDHSALPRGDYVVDRILKNVAATVHQRLLNKAAESSRPFNELLQRFAIAP
jgi:hypothetical protein